MSLSRQLQRRRIAALRSTPLADGRRDPLDPFHDQSPSTFGLSQHELQAHADQLLASGWSMPEIRQRLRLPEPRRACICSTGITSSTPAKEAA